MTESISISDVDFPALHVGTVRASPFQFSHYTAAFDILIAPQQFQCLGWITPQFVSLVISSLEAVCEKLLNTLLFLF